MSQSIPDAASFEELYRRLGVDGALDMSCPNARACWPENHWLNRNGVNHDEGERTSLPRPWVGPNYEDLRLVCLAINMNDSGGREECASLVTESRERIREGYTRVRFRGAPHYAGTFLYHRMGSYAVEIAAHAGYVARPPSGQKADFAQVAEVFDWLAYTNQVKCSENNGERSKPTSEMWERCGAFILRPELALLRPRTVLILGSGQNAWFFFNRVADSGSESESLRLGKIRIGNAAIAGKPVRVIMVPHPSAPGGMALKHVMDLREALQGLLPAV